MALMALATSIAVPILKGTTTNAQKDTYRSYCLQAKMDGRSFVNMINAGYTVLPITASNYSVTNVSLTTASGLTKAMNYQNKQAKYQYYVIGFTASNCSTDPTTTLVNAQFDSSVLDVIVPVIEYISNTKTYKFYGVWYYSQSKQRIVMTYSVSNVNWDYFRAF